MLNHLFHIDWQAMFVPSVSLIEIALRGTIIYFLILILFRILRRQAGAVGITDLLVVVMVADAAQNAMSSEYRSITEGAVLVLTIAAWDYFLDWSSFRSPAIRRLLSPPPSLLVRDGELQRRQLRQELISEEELMEHIRRAGIEELNDVIKC